MIYILRIVRQGVVKKNQKCIRINDLQILEGSSELRVYANHSYVMNDYSDNFPFFNIINWKGGMRTIKLSILGYWE